MDWRIPRRGSGPSGPEGFGWSPIRATGPALSLRKFRSARVNTHFVSESGARNLCFLVLGSNRSAARASVSRVGLGRNVRRWVALG